MNVGGHRHAVRNRVTQGYSAGSWPGLGGPDGFARVPGGSAGWRGGWKAGLCWASFSVVLGSPCGLPSQAARRLTRQLRAQEGVPKWQEVEAVVSSCFLPLCSLA